MIMEWVDGMNLSELARQLRAAGQRMPLPVVAFVIGEVLRGLAYAHTITHEGDPLGVVHRDVSPQNVLISVSGEVKLTDFGVARLAQEDTSGVHAKGKLRYMSPEQVRGHSSRPTVDLYAVGAILHELLDGTKFRDARDETHLYGLALGGEVPALRIPDVPRELDELRLALLETEPGARVQTAERALELLMRWPGYRNASMELGRLCRAFMGVAAPRSGIHGRTTRDTDPSQPTTDPASRDPLETRTWAGSGPSAADEPGSPRSRPTPVALLAGIAFAAFLVLGIGGTVAAGKLGGVGPFADARAGAGAAGGTRVAAATPTHEVTNEATAPEPATSGSTAAPTESADDAAGGAREAGTTVEEPVDPALEPVREPIVTPRPSKKRASGSTPKMDDGSTEAIAAPTEKPAAVPAPEPPSHSDVPAVSGPEAVSGDEKAVVRASVTFKTGDFPFVWVKVAGKVLALEPVKKVKLKAGQHPVYFRIAESEPWTRAGSIDIDGGSTYAVKMKKPGSLLLEKTGI